MTHPDPTSPAKRFAAAIFDFDYTLADSAAAVVECANTALRALGLPPASEEAICRTIGLTIPDTLATLAGEAHRRRLPEFRQHWRQRSDEIMVDWTEVFPYVPAAMRRLRGAGLKTGIVSTKYRHRIEAVLQRDDLQNCFDVIVGGEDVAEFKPHPEGLLAAISRLGCDTKTVIYVGDSLTDAEAARRAEVPFAAVLSGKTERGEFEEHSPIGIFENVGEFSTWAQ